MTFSVLAPFKVNLFLHVTGQKPNGYHTLQSHVMFADYGDEIILEKSDQYILIVKGAFAKTLDVENNLVTKAVNGLTALINKTPSIAITLIKNTPVGAGLGGGSSDVAAIIKALIKFWDVTPDPKALNALLLSLGADVPACFHGASCWVEEIGEDITPLPCSAYPAVIIFPNMPCHTASIFKDFKEEFSDDIATPEMIDLNFIKAQKNDLTQAAIQSAPSIQQALETLNKEENIAFNRMSGSGSACFGVCDTIDNAQSIAGKIGNIHPEWWVKAVTLS